MRLFPSKAAAAALLALGLAGCAREGDITRPASSPATPPARRSRSPRRPATSPCSIRRKPRLQCDRRRRPHHQRAQQLQRDRRIYRHPGDFRHPGAAPRRPGARDVVAPLFRRPSCRAAPTSSPSGSAAPGCASRTASSALQHQRHRELARAPLGGDPARGHPPPDHPPPAADDADAAIDPMADPAVRAAVERARFELLIGFELTQDQLRYNATR